MTLNMRKLRGKITENGLTHAEFAERIGVNPTTLYRKLNSDGLTFTIGQMHKIVEVLRLSDDEARQIFLEQYSHKCKNHPDGLGTLGSI